MNWKPLISEQHAPTPQQAAWMQGLLHHDLYRHTVSEWMRVVRRRNFIKACLEGDQQLMIWPEFQQAIRELKLEKPLRRSTLNLAVVGILVAENNRSVGPWLKKAEWMERRGKDPMKRRRYRKAVRLIYVQIPERLKYARKRHQAEIAALEAMASS